VKLDYEQYRLIVEWSPNMIWRSGTDGMCNYFNKTWLDFTGKTQEEEMGNGWAEGVHPEDFDRCLDIYMTNFKKRQSFEMEYRLRRHDGQYRWINDIGVPFYDDAGEFQGFIGSCVDVTEKIEGKRYKEMAMYDSLTKVYTRQFLLTLLDEEHNRAKIYGRPISLIMMDLDDLKPVNDNHGHHVGDQLLKLFAKIITESIREKDLFGRFGGDEFLIVLPETALQSARVIADRIVSNLRQARLNYEDINLPVSASLGLAESSGQETVQELLIAVDKELYASKKRKPSPKVL